MSLVLVEPMWNFLMYGVSDPRETLSHFMDGVVHPAKKIYPKVSFQREGQPKNIKLPKK